MQAQPVTFHTYYEPGCDLTLAYSSIPFVSPFSCPREFLLIIGLILFCFGVAWAVHMALFTISDRERLQKERALRRYINQMDNELRVQEPTPVQKYLQGLREDDFIPPMDEIEVDSETEQAEYTQSEDGTSSTCFSDLSSISGFNEDFFSRS